VDRKTQIQGQYSNFTFHELQCYQTEVTPLFTASILSSHDHIKENLSSPLLAVTLKNLISAKKTSPADHRSQDDHRMHQDIYLS